MRTALPGLLLAALALPVPAGRARTADQLFGRWQDQPTHCSLQRQGTSPQTCRELQLDQRDQAVLRLTLWSPGSQRGGLRQVTLVGELPAGSEPMRCRNGECQLEKPLQLVLSGLSQAEFNSRGLVQGLPRTWPLQGSCQLSPALISCEAQESSGSNLTLRAELR